MLIERMRKRLSADRASFIEPCLPSPADKPPSGSNWIHEIKHDGYRLVARRDPVCIRLIREVREAVDCFVGDADRIIAMVANTPGEPGKRDP